MLVCIMAKTLKEKKEKIRYFIVMIFLEKYHNKSNTSIKFNYEIN